MAILSHNQQEKKTHADTADFEREANLSESEIDSYILSVPDLSKKQAQKKKEAKKKKKTADISEPSTPKRVPSTTSMASYDSSRTGPSMLTPPSLALDRTRAKSHTSSPGNDGGGDAETAPETPRKKIGWLGTDARVWSSRGYKSPCKTSKNWVE